MSTNNNEPANEKESSSVQNIQNAENETTTEIKKDISEQNSKPIESENKDKENQSTVPESSNVNEQKESDKNKEESQPSQPQPETVPEKKPSEDESNKIKNENNEDSVKPQEDDLSKNKNARPEINTNSKLEKKENEEEDKGEISPTNKKLDDKDKKKYKSSLSSTSNPNQQKNLPNKYLTYYYKSDIEKHNNHNPDSYSNDEDMTMPINLKDDYLTRLQNYQINKKDNLQKLKKKTLEEESRKLQEIPRICERSKKICQSSNNMSFLQRMNEQNLQREKNKKNLQKKINEMKKREDDIIYKKVNELNKKKASKSQIEETNKKLKLVEDSRKLNKNKLIEKVQKDEMKECSFKPKINENNFLIKVNKKKNRNKSCVTDRLYQNDIDYRKSKMRTLSNSYLPTFTPETNYNKKMHQTIDSNYSRENNKKRLCRSLIKEKQFNDSLRNSNYSVKYSDKLLDSNGKNKK